MTPIKNYGMVFEITNFDGCRGLWGRSAVGGEGLSGELRAGPPQCGGGATLRHVVGLLQAEIGTVAERPHALSCNQRNGRHCVCTGGEGFWGSVYLEHPVVIFQTSPAALSLMLKQRAQLVRLNIYFMLQFVKRQSQAEPFLTTFME